MDKILGKQAPKKDQDNEHWVSMSDLMAGLMMVFMFISIAYMHYVRIEKEKINSVVKNYELSYNTEVKENSFWLNYLYQKITVPDYKLATPKEYRELMTKENLWKVNRKAINLKNYIDVTLIPEKEKI